MKLYSTLALGVSLAAATDPECSAQCGSEIGFVSSQGPELLIKYDGKQLHVPQHCRSEVCSELTSDSAALKAQVAVLESAAATSQGAASSQLAVNAALRTLLADQAALIEELSARLATVAAVQQQDTARHEEQIAAVKRDTASADAALHAAVGAVKLYAENTAYVAPTPAPTTAASVKVEQGLIAKYEFNHGNCDDTFGKYNGVNHGGSFGGSHLRVGGGSYVEIDGLRNYPWGDNFSACTWFKRDSSAGDYMGILSTGYYLNGAWEIRQGGENGGTRVGGLLNIPGHTPTWTFGGNGGQTLSAPVAQWNHVCMAWDGQVGNYFLNGKLVDSTSMQGNTSAGARGPVTPTSNGVFIGTADGGMPGHEYFRGEIDDVRLYKRAVDAEDVAFLFSQKPS
jgi:hypothetical protein